MTNPLHAWLLNAGPMTTSEIYAELELLRKHDQPMKGMPATFDDLDRELKRLVIGGRIEGKRNEWGQVEWMPLAGVKRKVERVLF